jgi:hypothetical protein
VFQVVVVVVVYAEVRSWKGKGEGWFFFFFLKSSWCIGDFSSVFSFYFSPLFLQEIHPYL